MYSLAQSVAPTAEPVTLAEAKAQCSVPQGVTQHDEKLTRYIAAARQEIENATNRQLVTATWVFKLCAFPYSTGKIYLPKAPLISVTSIAYLEASAGVSTTWSTSNYRVSSGKEPAEITLAYGVSFPAVYPVSDAVTITYTAGYGAPAAVPANAKSAVLLKVESLFDPTRAKENDRAVEALVSHLRYGDAYTCYEVAYA
jgi:uncharacterized phiE125 gp8 family phage protein